MAAPISPWTDRRDRNLFAGAVAAFLVYAGFFIARTSFTVAGERYFSLFDDAMVSMRYAKNFANGYGLVWNPGGAPVEGYTNSLWVLYMSVIHFFPVPPSKTSLFVQVSAALFLAANLYYTRRVALAISGGSRSVAWGAIVLTATYLPLNNWALQGMEVSVLVLLMTMCTWLAIRSLDTGTFTSALYVLLGIGTWVRPDIAVPYLGFLSFMLVADPAHRRHHTLWGVGVLVFVVVVQSAFRLGYYGDILPNTYYLKMTGVPLTVRVARGAYVLLQFIWKASPLLFVLPLLLLLRKDRRVWLLFWTVAVQMAYSVGVGGDAWEYWGGSNRYIAIAMPAFFVLLACALRLSVSAVVEAAAGFPERPAIVRSMSSAAFALAVFFAVVRMNSIHGIAALAEVALVEPPLHTGSGGENQRDVEQALLLRGATTPEATIAVMRAGTIPYFADRPAVDLLGKNDRFIAHGPVAAVGHPIRFTEFKPGHMKFNFAHSIGRGRPDLILQLRQRAELAKPFVKDAYAEVQLGGGCVLARRDSPHVLWNRLPAVRCADDASSGAAPID
jgi:hypothetical protein